MSGGLSWAITEPSLYSTIEWTIDCGWITTPIWSADRSNSQRASMISRALFINVAESTVIFGPIAQVGWARASATVTWASCSGENVRNGPPLAVSTTRRTSSRSPRLQRLKHRAVFAIDGQDLGVSPPGQLGNQRSADHEALFVGQGHRLAGIHGRPGAPQAGAADDGRDDDVHFRVGRQSGKRLGADQQLDAGGQRRPVLPGRRRRDRSRRSATAARPGPVSAADRCCRWPTGRPPAAARRKRRSPPACCGRCFRSSPARRYWWRGQSFGVIVNAPPPADNPRWQGGRRRLSG